MLKENRCNQVGQLVEEVEEWQPGEQDDGLLEIPAFYLRIFRLPEIDEAVEVAHFSALVPLRAHVIKIEQAPPLVTEDLVGVVGRNYGPDLYVELGVAHAARVGIGKGEIADVHSLLLVQLKMFRIGELSEKVAKEKVGQISAHWDLSLINPTYFDSLA